MRPQTMRQAKNVRIERAPVKPFHRGFSLLVANQHSTQHGGHRSPNGSNFTISNARNDEARHAAS